MFLSLGFILAEGRKGQFETVQSFLRSKKTFWKPIIYWFFCGCLVGFIVVDIEHNQPEKVP